MQTLAQAQMGAIRAVLFDRGREPVQALSAHFARQREKAVKKEQPQRAAAFGSLQDALERVGSLAGSEGEDAAGEVAVALGKQFDHDAFELEFVRAAVEGFFLNLTHLLQIVREMKVCLID